MRAFRLWYSYSWYIWKFLIAGFQFVKPYRANFPRSCLPSMFLLTLFAVIAKILQNLRRASCKISEYQLNRFNLGFWKHRFRFPHTGYLYESCGTQQGFKREEISSEFIFCPIYKPRSRLLQTIIRSDSIFL